MSGRRLPELLLNVPKVMDNLARSHPVFRNEKDFERAFAAAVGWRRTVDRALNRLLGPRKAVDLLLRAPGNVVTCVIELKFARVESTYRVGKGHLTVGSSESGLIGKVDCLHDLGRLESIKSLRPDVEAHFVLLSNDESYWAPKSQELTRPREDFGDLWWDCFKDGGVIGPEYVNPPWLIRGEDVQFSGTYRVSWNDYSAPEGGRPLRYTHILVEA